MIFCAPAPMAFSRLQVHVVLCHADEEAAGQLLCQRAAELEAAALVLGRSALILLMKWSKDEAS